MRAGTQVHTNHEVDSMQSVKKIVGYVNLLSWVNKESIVKSLPYMAFIVALCFAYIANSYQADKSIRKIDALNKELKELRSEYIAGKSELMIRSRQSNVASQVEALGLKESTTPPGKILAGPKPVETKK